MVVNEFEEVGLIGGGSGMYVGNMNLLRKPLADYTVITHSTPLYQVVTHALADKSNKTRFTLIFSNVTEADILLREEFDAMKKKFPDTFNVVYVLDKPGKGWKGA